MTEKMRLFFAVEIPTEIRCELEKFSQSIDKNSWRLVKPEQMHVTLAFMGEVPEDQLPKVVEAGEAAAAKITGFSSEFCDTGVFPESGEPGVLFAKVASPELINLALSLRQDLGSLADQKKIRPHLTLARRKNKRVRKELRKIRGCWKVDSFTLFRSILSESGASHEVVRRFALKTT